MCTTVLLFVAWCRVCVLSKRQFLLEDKQETKFGGVMSAKSTHILLASVLHFHVDFMIII